MSQVLNHTFDIYLTCCTFQIKALNDNDKNCLIQFLLLFSVIYESGLNIPCLHYPIIEYHMIDMVAQETNKV